MKTLLEKYLNDVCRFVKCKKIHTDIRQELKSHIDELVEEYISSGLNENTAIEKAISEMGDSSEVGKRINEQHKPQTNWFIIFLTVVISLFGLTIIFTSSKFSHSLVDFGNYILYVFLGIGIAVITYFIDYTLLKKFPYVTLGVGLFLFIITILLGNQVNGAFHYLRIASFSINASPIISILFLISFSVLLDKYKGNGDLGILKLILIGAITLLPLLIFPDVASAIILLIAYIIMLFTAIIKGHFGGNKKIQIISLGILGILFTSLLIVFLILGSPYRLQRILTFFDGGYNDPSGSGWIMVMANKIFNSLNWIGKANPLAEGNVEYVLPGITNNYILLNIMYHFGIVVGIVLIAFVLLLIMRMFASSYKIKNSFGFYISIGASSFLAVQFILNILMNFNLIPVSDIIMPFVSYSGTAYITNMFLVGIVLSVWRRNNIIKNDKMVKQKPFSFISLQDGKLTIDFKIRKDI